MFAFGSFRPERTWQYFWSKQLFTCDTNFIETWLALLAWGSWDFNFLNPFHVQSTFHQECLGIRRMTLGHPRLIGFQSFPRSHRWKVKHRVSAAICFAETWNGKKLRNLSLWPRKMCKNPKHYMLHWLRFLDLISNFLWYSIINPFILLDIKDSYLPTRKLRIVRKQKSTVVINEA